MDDVSGAGTPWLRQYSGGTSSPQVSGSSRLSGLFHQHEDANRHPAPPPSRENSHHPHDADGGPAISRARRASRGTSLGSSLEALFMSPPPPQDPSSPVPPPHTPRRAEPLQSPPMVTSPIFTSLSASAGLARLIPQMTGTSVASSSATASKHTGGWGKKLSIASLGSWVVGGGSQETAVDQPSYTVRSPTRSVSSLSEVSEVPLEKQVTGGLWGWWAGEAGDDGSPQALLKPIRQA
jgi:hypothetical protein